MFVIVILGWCKNICTFALLNFALYISIPCLINVVMLYIKKIKLLDPEGSGGEGSGRGDRDGEYM